MKRLIRKADDQQNQNNINENTDNVSTNDISTQNTESIGDIPMIDTDMVQRLRNEVKEDFESENNTNMIKLDELDEADVRHDKCPQCKYQPMVRKEGFKVCPSCGTIYKVMNGKGYVIVG